VHYSNVIRMKLIFEPNQDNKGEKKRKKKTDVERGKVAEGKVKKLSLNVCRKRQKGRKSKHIGKELRKRKKE